MEPELDLSAESEWDAADWSALFNSFFLDRPQGGDRRGDRVALLPFFDDKMVETMLGFEAADYSKLGAATP